MSSNKFLCLSALLLTVFLLKTSEARPSLDPLQTKVNEAGGNPGKGRNVHVHHTQGPAHTHTHKVVAGGEGDANQNGEVVTHVHTFKTDGADNVHTVKTDGANNVNSVTITGGPSDQQQNTVRTISLSQLPIPVVDTTVVTQTNTADAGNKSPSVTVPNAKLQQCQKGLVNGVASKAKDIINGGASQLGNIINRLTKNGKLLGPVGGIVNAVGQGVDDLFENGISGINYGIHDIICGLEGIGIAAAQTLDTGNVPKGVADVGKTILKETKSVITDLVGAAGTGVRGTASDVKDVLKNTLQGLHGLHG